MLSFFSLKNNSITIRLNFLLDSISTIISSNTIKTLVLMANPFIQLSVSLFDYILPKFHKHHQLFVNNNQQIL